MQIFKIKISDIITSTLKLEYSDGEKIEVSPPDAGKTKYNFFNRVCLRYEAEECRLAISKGIRNILLRIKINLKI